MTRLDSKLEGVDIVSAITQSTINSQFAAFWQLKIIPDHLELNISKRLGKLDVNLLAPTVKLGLEDKPRQILFSQPFSSGCFHTFDDESDAPKDIPFSAGALAFLVDVDLSHMDPLKAPNSVRDAIKNLTAGTFSMRQLYLNFENAALASYDPQHTTLPKSLLEEPGFLAGLMLLFKKLSENGANVLGYTITVTNPNDVAPETPTFPPTDIDFATHIFLDPVTGKRNPDRDTLNYLLMTQHRPLPKTLPLGNFVESDVDGTMAVSRALFLEGFLLPRLADVTNLTTSLTGISKYGAPLDTTRGGAFRPAGVADKKTFDERVSEVERIIKDVIWEDREAPPPAKAGPRDPTETRWIFESTNSAVKVESGHPWGGANTVFQGAACHFCEVSIAPGSNEIALRGMSALGLGTTVYAGIAYHAANERHCYMSQTTWKASIKLVAGSSGFINSEFDFHADPVKNESWANPIGNLGNMLVPKAEKEVLEGVSTAFNNGFQRMELAKLINKAILSQGGFFFPGGNQYLFKDLVFSKSADLMASLTIKFY